MKIGKVEGCIFNDRIDLELSPSDLEGIIELCEAEVMSEKNYSFQGLYRERKDYLQSRFDAWEKARDEKDKEPLEDPRD